MITISGGHFSYADQTARSEIFNYCGDSKNVPNVFKDKEISEIVWDVFELIHDFDWYVSGDTGEGQWNKAVHEFKEKWFTDAGRAERYDRYLKDSLKEMREMLGLENLFCKDCEIFQPGKEGVYGKCKHHKYVLIHGWEKACDEHFIKKEEYSD